MIKKGKKLSMMLLTAMILAAGSVGTVAGTGAETGTGSRECILLCVTGESSADSHD